LGAPVTRRGPGDGAGASSCQYVLCRVTTSRSPTCRATAVTADRSSTYTVWAAGNADDPPDPDEPDEPEQDATSTAPATTAPMAQPGRTDQLDVSDTSSITNEVWRLLFSAPLNFSVTVWPAVVATLNVLST
jgi:hypothetical protein